MTQTTAFRAGYEAGKRDAIDRCLVERVPKSEPGWRGHNVALGLAVVAIRALDVRHAMSMKEDPMATESTGVIITKFYQRDIVQIMVDQGRGRDVKGQRDIDYMFPLGVSHIVCSPDEAIEIIVRRVKMK